jgi:hypothetical protein
MGFEKKIYIDYNLNKNQLKQVLLENNTYDVIPTPNSGEDKGLIYFDTNLNRILVWDGDNWKIVQYLDDRDLSNTQDVIVENIWVESDLIPTVLATASSSDIVEEIIGTTMSYVSNSYSFRYSISEDVVPSSYGSFYEPVLKTYNDITVPVGFKNWTVEYGSDFIQVTLYGGFSTSGSYIITPTNPPKLDYWRYTGRKGSFKFIGGFTNIMEITPLSIPYNLLSLPTYVRRDNIVSLTVNGVVIYEWTYDENTQIITIDEFLLGYAIDGTDTLRIELNV